MKDCQIRLNELISSKDLTAKRRGSLYILNNSLKRSTLNTFTPNKNEDIGYDCKLPQMSLRRKELTKILDLILSKEEMTLADRNFLRRILVTIFDEELIFAGSRNFINHLNVQKHRAEDIVATPSDKLFYLVLKGAATVSSGGFTYEVAEGDTFGERELLSNEAIEDIKYTQHTLLLTLNQVNFDNYFRNYFQKMYNQKLQLTSSIYQRCLQDIPLINRYYFLDEIQFQTFNSGDKIIEKGKAVNRLYFVGNSWKGELQSNLVDGCFGLKEVMKNKQNYLESAYSLDLGYKVPYVQKQVFIKYVKNYLNDLSQLFAQSTINKSKIHHNPQEKQTKKMSLKKVKMLHKTKKAQTEPFDSIVSQFKFFRGTDLQPVTPTKPLLNLKGVEKEVSKRKSFSIRIKSNNFAI